MLSVEHDTDQMIFDEIIRLSISLFSRIQVANQNRFKNYNIIPFFKNVYVSPFSLITVNHVFAKYQITTIYINPV